MTQGMRWVATGRVYPVAVLMLLSLLSIACAKDSDAKASTKSPAASVAETSATPSPMVPGKVYLQAPGGLYLRESASASSAKLAFIPYGESMQALAQGEAAETIGEATGRWLEVEYYGTRGWAFGGFVSDSQPPMAIVSGQAVGEAYGYDRIGAYNLDTRQFYAVENHARPFIGGIEEEMSSKESAEMFKKISRDNEAACYFEISGLPPGRYSVYTWQSGFSTHALAYMEKGSYDRDAREPQEVTPSVIELKAGGNFPGVFFENSVFFDCGGLPGQSEPLPLSGKRDFSLAAQRCLTTRPTTLFGVPSDFLTGKALSGGRVLDLDVGAELRADPERPSMACGCRTLVSVLDEKGGAWWADAFDLAVGCGFSPRRYSHDAATFRDAVFILGHSGANWIFRRIGKDMETGSFGASSGEIVPGAALIGAGILAEPAMGDFSNKGFKGDLGILKNVGRELGKLDPDTEGLAEFEEYLRPYI